MNFIKKYKHGFVIVTYAILYLVIFQYLEQRHVYSYHLIHCALDDLIPFCEYFIVLSKYFSPNLPFQSLDCACEISYHT